MRLVRRPLVALLLAVAVAVILADQLTKVWALANLTEGVRTPVLGDLLGLSLIFNAGAALSIAEGMTWIFTIAALAVAVVILRVASRLGSRSWAIALGLLLGGAVGNLIDRLFRAPGFGRGHVIDFIAYGNLFIGNVADVAIVVAAVVVVLLSLRGIAVDGSRAGVDTQPEGQGDVPVADAGSASDDPVVDGAEAGDPDGPVTTSPAPVPSSAPEAAASRAEDA